MPEKKLKVQKHKDYGSYTLVAFIIPVAGFILGIIYMTKEDELDKKLGLHLLAVSVLSSILFTLAWMLLMGDTTTSTSSGYYY